MDINRQPVLQYEKISGPMRYLVTIHHVVMDGAAFVIESSLLLSLEKSADRNRWCYQDVIHNSPIESFHKIFI